MQEAYIIIDDIQSTRNISNDNSNSFQIEQQSDLLNYLTKNVIILKYKNLSTKILIIKIFYTSKKNSETNLGNQA